jgi:DNA processing protein
MSGHAPGLSRDEGLARIRLIRSPNIGPVTFAQLLRRFGNARAAMTPCPIWPRGARARGVRPIAPSNMA